MSVLSDNPNAPNNVAHERKKARNTKRTGELAEAAFLHKAVKLGFRVTKPWNDSERYDFVLDSGRRLWRVQIKCTVVARAEGTIFSRSILYIGRTKWLTRLTTLTCWRLMLSLLMSGTWSRLRRWLQGRVCGFIRDDGCKTARFEKYREAWDLFRGKTAEAPDEGESVAAGEELQSRDEAVSECFVRRPPVWRPRFFWR
jgi:PD-(D/E)XK nuclease superfamily protein